MTDRRAAGFAGGATLFLCLATLALYWPGYASYDSVVQYGQLLSGQLDDWHPPIMVRLWAALGGARWGGAPMFLLQIALYWLGLGLIATRLASNGRACPAAFVLLLCLLPPALSWQVVILKDAQMTGAMLAAAGLACWWRLDDRPIPRPVWLLIALLLAYAMLVRANGAMAAIPLAVMLAPRPARWLPRLALTAAGILAILALSPLINHRLLGASDSGVTHTQPLFDLAGISVRAPGDPLLPASDALKASKCVTPLYWDPLGQEPCSEIVARWEHLSTPALLRTTALAILRHPMAYALHRLAHLNSTERWLVPSGWLNARPLLVNEPNTLGLTSPGKAATAAQRIAAAFVDTPLAWPICYVVLALMAFAATLRLPPAPRTTMAAALALSALALEASFAVISIASDLRYHLWPMLASCLALAVLPRGSLRSLKSYAVAALMVVIFSGIGARIILLHPL